MSDEDLVGWSIKSFCDIFRRAGLATQLVDMLIHVAQRGRIAQPLRFDAMESFQRAVADNLLGIAEVLAIKTRSNECIQDYLSFWIDNGDFARDVAALTSVEFWPHVVHLTVDGQILRNTTVQDISIWI